MSARLETSQAMDGLRSAGEVDQQSTRLCAAFSGQGSSPSRVPVRSHQKAACGVGIAPRQSPQPTRSNGVGHHRFYQIISHAAAPVLAIQRGGQ